MPRTAAELATPLAVAPGASGFAVDLLIVLAVASVVAIALQRLRMAVIPAYLIAGAVIGPNALGLVAGGERLTELSDLAILLLMFGVGMQLELSALRRDARRLIAGGALSAIVTAAAGYPVARAFGLEPRPALAVVMALSLSSTAVVLKVLSARRELHAPAGRLSFAILVTQDLLVVAMLGAIPLLARGAETQAPAGAGGGGVDGSGPGGAFTSFLVSILGVAAIVLVGRLALPRLFREAARARSDEAMVVLSVAAALGAGAAAQALGFSPELGAFLAGFVLSATPFRHHLSGQIGPARDIFVAVFFTTLGMSVDPGSLAGSWWAVLLATGVMIALKLTGIAAAAWITGATAAAAITVGFSLAQAGEFSLVVLDAAQAQGLLTEEMISLLTGIVALSLILTPTLMQAGRALAATLADAPTAPWVRALAPDETTAPDHGHVIVAGFGPIGRAVTDQLEAKDKRVVVVDLNPRTVKACVQTGRRAVFGDVGNAEVLESAGVREAAAIVLAAPDHNAVLRAASQARRLAPSILIVARASFLSRAFLAKEHGADVVVVEEITTAEAMQREVMRSLAERLEAPEE